MNSVVNPTCSLCDFAPNSREEFIEHCVKGHGRSWEALVIRLESGTKSIEGVKTLCKTVERYIPEQ